MPKFKKNPNPIMKKQAYGKGKSPFTMKSPLKHPAVPQHKNPHKKGDVKETPTYTSPGWPKLKH